MADESNSSNDEDFYEDWLADKGWIQVQKKTFTNWMNHKLKETDRQIVDIEKDLADGIALIKLLEVLTNGKNIGRYKKSPRMDIHKRENLEIAFRFMKDVEKIPLVNIGAEDIHERNLKLILAVLWALILHYQIAEGEPQKRQTSAKKRLLGWVNACLPDNGVKNFTTDWNDGRNLAALVDFCKPGLIPDYASLDSSNRFENITRAMDIAEKELNVPQVLHPEDLAVYYPDEMSVMTYISGFCRQFSPGQIALLEWINECIPNCPATNFTTDWSDGQRLGALTDSVSEGEFPEADQMSSEDGVKNCQEAMDAANSVLGIEQTIQPKDFADENLDQLTRMTYLTQFRHAKRPKRNIASFIKALGTGITGDTAEKKTAVLVSAPRIPNWTKLDVQVTNPDGKKVPVKNESTDAEENSFTYTPETVGEYVVDIKLNDMPIPNSPFHVSHTAPSNAKACVASASGLSKAHVGKSCRLSVNCEQGGPGELMVKIKGPNGRVSATMKEPKEHNYDVSFNPSEPGEHKISITWDEKPIPNSPFTCIVTDPKKCTASGPGLTRASVEGPQVFNVKAENAGPGKLSAEVKGPSGNVPIDIANEGNGNFTCTYVPKDKGPHTINIHWSDVPIPGSPFKVNVTPPSDASKCVVTELPEGRLRATKTYSFKVDAREAGPGELTSSTSGPTLPLNYAVTKTSSDTYTVQFTPVEVGLLRVIVSYANSAIPGSPFEFTVNDPIRVTVNRAAIENGSYQVKQPIDFCVSAQYAGEGEISANVHAPDGTNNLKIKDQGDKTYLMHYTPSESGTHAFRIKFDGEEIPDEPIRVFVEAGSFAENVVVTQPAPSKIGAYIIELPYTYKVNTAGAGEGTLTATRHGAHTGQKPKVSVTDDGNGRYGVSVEAEEPDTYMVNIQWSEEDVPGSPFTLSVQDKPRPEKVVCIGPHFEVGSSAPITLYVNTENAGAGKLDATCLGKDAGSVATEITEREPRKYVVSFSPPKFDVYSIHVLWASRNVTNSPFTVNIIPPDASKCIVAAPEIPEGPNEPVVVHVDASNAGNGKLAASAVGDSIGEVDVDVKKTEPNKFDISFVPTDNENYNLSVTWSDEDVPGSPFKVKSSTPNASKVFICESPPTELNVGQPISICFDASEAGRGEFTAVCKGNKVGEIPVLILQRSVLKDKFEVCFTPRERDVFVLTAFWGGERIKESPYTFSLKPVDVNKVRVIGPTMPQGLDGPVELMLQTSGAGKGKVTGTCIGRKSGEVNVIIKETSTDIFQLGLESSQPDIYTFAVQYDEQNIIGSPFIINTHRPNAANVRVTEPDTIGISQRLHFKVDVTDAGNGKLRSTCHGEKYGQVQLDTFEESTTLYDVSFTPHHADRYSITMEWEGEEVPNSPFDVDLRPPMADQVNVGELHVPEEAGTGENIWIDIDCSDAGHGPVKAEARGELSGTITVETVRVKRAKYCLTFASKQSDMYHFMIFYGEHQVLKVPFTINLTSPQQIDFVKYIRTQMPAFEGDKVSLFFSTEDAGSGKLTADVAGESCGAVPTKVKQVSPFEYQVTFVPDKPEVYNAVILWSDKPVKDSPFKVDTRPTLHPELVECGQPTYTDVHEPVQLPVDLRKAGPGKLTAKCVDDSGSTIQTEVKRTSSPDLYSVSFTPGSPGKHDLSVFFEGAEIECSPFPIDIKPEPVSAGATEDSKVPPVDFSLSAASTDDIDEPISQELSPYSDRPFDMSLESQDHSSSTVFSEGGDFSIMQHSRQLTSHTHSGGVVQRTGQFTEKLDVNMSRSSDSSCSMLFNFTFNLQSGAQARAQPCIDASRCRVFGLDKIPPLLYVNKALFFGVDAKKAGDSSLTVSSDGPSTEDKPTVLDVKESEEEPGMYHITYVPTAMGLHTIHLMWNGKKIPESPLQFEVKFLMYPFGEPVSMDINADCKQGHFGATAIHQRTHTKHKVNVTRLYKGKFKLTFQPKEPGVYFVHVYVKKIQIPGSPYQINVVKQSDSPPPVRVGKLHKHDPDPAGVRIVEEDLCVFKEVHPVGQPVSFNITTKDAGQGNINIRSRGPGKPVVKVFDNKDDSYTCEFTPSMAGRYHIDILWNDEHIRGSPYLLTFKSDTDVSVIAGQGVDLELENFRVGIPHRFKFECGDIGDGILEVLCDPPSGAQISLHQIEDTSYHQCQIVPLEVGNHQITVQFNDQHIFGSPFNVHFEQRGDASKCRIIENVGENQQDTVNFCVSTSGAGRGKLAASVENINTVEWVPVSVTQSSDDRYNVEFNPTEGAEYLLTVKYDDQNISGSPFPVVCGAPGMDAASSLSSLDYPFEMRALTPCKPERVKAYGPGLQDGFVGQEGNFKVETAEGGSGTLQVKVHGPKGAFKINMRRHPENERTILVRYDPNHVGKYNVDITWSEIHIPGSPFQVSILEQKL